MSLRVRAILIVVLAGAVLAGCGMPGAGGGKAAVVNGKAITMAEFDKQVKTVRDSMVEQGLDPKSAEGKTTLDQVQTDILNQMIDTELMRQAAQKEGVTVTDADVNDRMQQFKKDAGGDEAFKKSLKDSNLTEEEFRTLVVRDQLVYERLYDKLTKSLPTAAEQVHVRHILLDTEKEARDIQARLAKGEDFAAIAKASSVDTQSKDAGGDLPFFPRGVLDPAFEEVIFRLKVKEIGMVKTDYGYHVVQVLEREASRQIAPDILQALGEEAINKYLDNLRATATVERIVQLPPTPTPSP